MLEAIELYSLHLKDSPSMALVVELLRAFPTGYMSWGKVDYTVGDDVT